MTTGSPAMHLPTLARSSGHGPFHFLLVPGLVPDGPETFLRQMRMLRSYGTCTTVTYPYEGFDLDTTLAALKGVILAAHEDGKLPVLVGVSVGGGLCLELMRRARDAGEVLPLSAVMLISPLSCIGDLAPLLSRLVTGIASEHARGDDGNPELALERGRSFFKTLASRSVAPRAQTGRLRSLLALLTPQGIADLGERRIRDRIDHTLANISPQGGIARTMAVTSLRGIDPANRTSGPITSAPTMILWGSKERHTLNIEGPGASILCRPDLASKFFPHSEIHWLYDVNGDEVPHASLLKHHHTFNRFLRSFIKRRLKAELAKVPIFARGPALMPFIPTRMF